MSVAGVLRDYEKVNLAGLEFDVIPQPGATVNQIGSMFALFFTACEVTDYESAKSSDTARFAKFFHAMLEEGIYLLNPLTTFTA